MAVSQVESAVSNLRGRSEKMSCQDRGEIIPTRHILVVGFKSVVLFAYRGQLMIAGVDIDECGFKDDYADLLRRQCYDAVITQIMNPITATADGLDVIRLVHERHPETKILVISANGSPSEKELALKSGAARYLAAPVFAPDIFDALRELDIVTTIGKRTPGPS